MLNRADIISELNNTHFNDKSFWVLAGSAMVIYELREFTNDIDLGCTKELADELEKKYKTEVLSSGYRKIYYNDNIEIFENWMSDYVVHFDRIPIVSFCGLIQMKKELGREKDLKDIELIKAFFCKKKVE